MRLKMKNLTFSKISLRVAALALLAVFGLAGCGGGATSVNGGTTMLDIGKVEPLDLAKVATDPQTGQQVVNDQILIIFKDTVSEDTAKAKIASINGEIVGYIKGMNDYQVRIKGNPALEQLKALVDQLNNDLDVEAASLNVIHESNRLPDSGNDPQWFADIDSDLTGWSEADPRGKNWGLEAIYAPSAWDDNDSMSIVKVGVVDGGFKTDHEDLSFKTTASGRRWWSIDRSYSVLEDFKDVPASCNGQYPAQTREQQRGKSNNHGTHVAGTIGAKSNNDKGITGIVWNHEMFAWRTDFQTYDIKYGIEWQLKQGVKVINLSIGSYVKQALCRDPSETNADDVTTYIDTPRKYWTGVMEKLKARYGDFLLVQAAGNEGIDAKWSGLFNSINDVELRKRIITVGAIDYAPMLSSPGQLSVFYELANFSSIYRTNHGLSVDVVAPGVGIYSTIYESPYYESMSGTSMAAPHVTGVVGLVWAANTYLTAEQVKKIIVDTADRPVIYKGHEYKILNAKTAVELANGGQAAPSAPTGVTATAGDGQVSISWNAVSSAISYNIYWSTTSGVSKTSYTGKISNVSSPYTHTGRTNGTTYYYVVTAVNGYGESVESSQVSATTNGTGGVSYTW